MMISKRMYGILILTSILFSIIIYRLANIQLFSTESFGPEKVNLLEKSVEQRSHEIILSNGRGKIIDRNGIGITSKKLYDLIVFPGIKKLDQTVKELTKTLNLSINDMESILNLDSPQYITELLDIEITEEQYSEITDRGFSGFYPVERTISKDPEIAQHFIGIVRNNPDLYKEKYSDMNFTLHDSKPVGISGIEEAFDPFLLSKESEKLLYHVDAVGQPMFGFDLRYSGYDNSFYPLTLKTTLDIRLQHKAESLLDKYSLKKGGIILLDVQSRDVLVMASRPEVNLNNPYDENSIENQILTRSAPGSVFKTVIAAATLEHLNIDNQRQFNCSKNLYGDKPDPRDLGMLNFEQSFAQSCNRTFGELATELMAKDPEIIEKYAKKLGLIGPVGWQGDLFQYNNFKQFPDEQAGIIWGEEEIKTDENFILQTAIGQKNVRVTPLAVANMMATIASNGVKKDVRGVNSILYKNGALMKEFIQDRNGGTNLINPYTAIRLKKLLYKVTESGTGLSLKGLQVAGKSGTAEGAKDNINHHWFGGFFPYEDPDYAMVIVDLENPTGQTNIYKIYRELVEFIYQSDS